MVFPKLPAKAAYITINNPHNRNALSLSVLRDLRSQLHSHMTSPRTGKLLTLPSFKRGSFNLEDADAGLDTDRNWMIDPSAWLRDRDGLPNALVLRSSSPDGPSPVFSAGHDLDELRSGTPEQAIETLDLTAEVASLLRRSPAPVVCAIHGLAAGAGFQLAMSADFPVALARTRFQLPGARLGLPCTAAAAAVAPRIRPGLAYRLLATGERVTAGELGRGILDVVPVPEHAESTDTAARAFEARVAEVVERLAGGETPGQPQAFAKWGFWTQASPGKKYDPAVSAMVRHLQNEEAKEGIRAWAQKRKPEWKT